MKHRIPIETIKRLFTTWWGLWIIFFIYTSLMALIIQFILPHVFPKVYWAHGIFVPDSTGFHQIAAQKALEIAEKGWSAWELRPQVQYPAGVASFFYYLWKPEPYSMIPFNAVLHATAGCLVFFLLSSFMKNRFVAAGGAILFIINPASLEWTAQIHRDGTYILGNLLILIAWLLLIKGVMQKKWQNFPYAFILTLSGSFLIWAPRPYWNQVALVACILSFALIVFYWVFNFRKSYLSLFWLTAAVVTGCFMIMVQLPFMDTSYSPELKNQENIERQEEAATSAQMTLGQKRKQMHRWVRTHYLPTFMESKLYGVWCYRKGAAAAGGNTVIDRYVSLNSAGAFIRYFPRALQIGFLSPFPSEWFRAGSTPATTIGKRIIGGIMIFFYICLAFFIWGLWGYRKSLEFWIITVYSTFGLIVFTYVHVNVGTLSRMRYGFYMVIIGIGFAFAVQKLIESRQNATAVLKKGI